MLTPAQPSAGKTKQPRSRAKFPAGRSKTPARKLRDQSGDALPNGASAGRLDADDGEPEVEGNDGSSDGDGVLLEDGLSSDGGDGAESDSDAALELDCFPEDVASALQGLLSAALNPSTFAAPSEDMGAASRSALQVHLSWRTFRNAPEHALA